MRVRKGREGVLSNGEKAMKTLRLNITFRLFGYFCLAIAFQSGALPGPAWAKDPSAVTAAAMTVDFEATVTAVREAPPGDPMPGVHLDVKLNNRVTDIYVGPASYLADCGLILSQGDVVHVTGTMSHSGALDIVIAHQIGVGRVTVYLRGDDGVPVWPGASTVEK